MQYQYLPTFIIGSIWVMAFFMRASVIGSVSFLSLMACRLQRPRLLLLIACRVGPVAHQGHQRAMQQLHIAHEVEGTSGLQLVARLAALGECPGDGERLPCHLLLLAVTGYPWVVAQSLYSARRCPVAAPLVAMDTEQRGWRWQQQPYMAAQGSRSWGWRWQQQPYMAAQGSRSWGGWRWQQQPYMAAQGSRSRGGWRWRQQPYMAAPLAPLALLCGAMPVCSLS